MDEHFIITRFNVGLYSKPDAITGFMEKAKPKDKEEWMYHRTHVFGNFYVASLLSQTCKNFSVVILLDRDTPVNHINNIKSLVSCIPCKLKIYMNDIKEVCEYLSQEYLGKEIITSRIDNDDAVSKDYIETTQTCLKENSQVLNFDIGYICSYKLTGKKFFLSKQVSNPFMSFKEKISEKALTVYCRNHTVMTSYYTTIRVIDKPSWIQTIHGNNISNAAPGNKPAVPLNEVEERFSISHLESQ